MNPVKAAMAGAALVGLGVVLGLRSETRGGDRPGGAADHGAPAAPARAEETPPAAAERAPAREVPVAAMVALPGASNESGAEGEVALMERLRRIRATDPELAIRLAREGNERFPESAGAPERASVIIHALAELGRPSEARGEAERMVNDYPDTPWAAEIEAFTGAHPHRPY